jgi:hypothetical protein
MIKRGMELCRKVYSSKLKSKESMFNRSVFQRYRDKERTSLFDRRRGFGTG